MSGLDLTLDPERQPRRFEVINGAGGRRQWSVDDKARVIAETLEPNAIISEVARRYGLRPQQVFAWRREAGKQAASVQQDSPAFVPAVVAAPTTEPTAKRLGRPRKQKTVRDADVIELEIDGIATRVGRGADAKTVAAVIRALKATA
ncbi:IS66-like element accessory protein TnpA [Mesorhizobium temperatum]|uniref:IS66-like element accessory protein TnpA n=1 Tax=Mesorhizobium temperatum TaxID=241416 RepID=UPI00142D65D7|nr:transposase [Mesorhizobium temperatum]